MIYQLARRVHTDAQPQPELARLLPGENSSAKDRDWSSAAYSGLTIVMACRNAKKAAQARDELLAKLDADIQQQRRSPTYDGYADEFREDLEINVHNLDLGRIKSVIQFGEEVKLR